MARRGDGGDRGRDARALRPARHRDGASHGRVALGEPSVAVVVAAPHRGAAFDACRYAIDALKSRVAGVEARSRIATAARPGSPTPRHERHAAPRRRGLNGRRARIRSAPPARRHARRRSRLLELQAEPRRAVRVSRKPRLRRVLAGLSGPQARRERRPVARRSTICSTRWTPSCASRASAARRPCTRWATAWARRRRCASPAAIRRSPARSRSRRATAVRACSTRSPRAASSTCVRRTSTGSRCKRSRTHGSRCSTRRCRGWPGRPVLFIAAERDGMVSRTSVSELYDRARGAEDVRDRRQRPHLRGRQQPHGRARSGSTRCTRAPRAAPAPEASATPLDRRAALTAR